MRHEIRKSDDGTFYYLLEIDASNNEMVLAQNESLAELKKHEALKGKPVDVVNEIDTRDTITPLKKK